MRKSVVFTIFVLLLWPLGCGPTSSNERPIANIAVDEDVVSLGEEVFLNGTGSADPDGDPLIFRWSLTTPSGSMAQLGNARARRVSFIPDKEGDYTIRLTVDDGALESSESVIISARVSDTNQAPVADAGIDITTEPEQTVQLDGTGSTDPDGDTLTYAWTIDSKPSESAVSLDDPSAAEPQFVPDVSGSYVFELEVTDPDGASDQDMVVVDVVQVNPNDPPVAEAGDPTTVEAGTQVTLDGSASTDPNGDTLTYLWAIDSAPSSSTATIENADQETTVFTPDVEGEYILKLTVGDGDATDSDTVTITAEPPLPCLIFGEIYEGDSFDKAVEIYNCGDSTIELSDFGYCLVQNANTTCNKDLLLSGELAAGETTVLCHTESTWVKMQNGLCEIQNDVVNFNGDDRMFIFEDSDSSDNYTLGETVVDAFGEIDNQPTSTPWAEKVYRRCNFEQYDGTGAFDNTLYYETVEPPDATHLGTPPTEGCP
ncbi:MAG: PKD domain-containing protein [Myxococcota bacterium]